MRQMALNHERKKIENSSILIQKILFESRFNIGTSLFCVRDCLNFLAE